MVKANKYLILIQLFLLNTVGQNLIPCAAIIRTEQKAIDIDLNNIASKYIKDRHMYCLIYAAVDNDKESVEFFIKYGADVNITKENGWTALKIAARDGYKEIVELLLHAGADLEYKFKDKKAIDLARENNREEIVKMLEGEPSRRDAVIKKWIKENLANKITESTSGQLITDISNIIVEYTPIEYNNLPLVVRIEKQWQVELDLELINSAATGNKQKIKQLINAGANVNATDKYADTALILAVLNSYKENGYIGYEEIVVLLLKAGTNIEYKNKHDVTAIDCARMYSTRKITKMIENEPRRRVAIVKKFIENNQKWIKENLAKKITESTSALLIADISNLISEYALEYTDLPLAVRLSTEENKEKIEQFNKETTKRKCVIS